MHALVRACFYKQEWTAAEEDAPIDVEACRAVKGSGVADQPGRPGVRSVWFSEAAYADPEKRDQLPSGARTLYCGGDGRVALRGLNKFNEVEDLAELLWSPAVREWVTPVCLQRKLAGFVVVLGPCGEVSSKHTLAGRHVDLAKTMLRGRARDPTAPREKDATASPAGGRISRDPHHTPPAVPEGVDPSPICEARASETRRVGADVMHAPLDEGVGASLEGMGGVDKGLTLRDGKPLALVCEAAPEQDPKHLVCEARASETMGGAGLLHAPLGEGVGASLKGIAGLTSRDGKPLAIVCEAVAPEQDPWHPVVEPSEHHGLRPVAVIAARERREESYPELLLPVCAALGLQPADTAPMSWASFEAAVLGASRCTTDPHAETEGLVATFSVPAAVVAAVFAGRPLPARLPPSAPLAHFRVKIKTLRYRLKRRWRHLVQQIPAAAACAEGSGAAAGTSSPAGAAGVSRSSHGEGLPDSMPRAHALSSEGEGELHAASTSHPTAAAGNVQPESIDGLPCEQVLRAAPSTSSTDRKLPPDGTSLSRTQVHPSEGGLQVATTSLPTAAGNAQRETHAPPPEQDSLATGGPAPAEAVETSPAAAAAPFCPPPAVARWLARQWPACDDGEKALLSYLFGDAGLPSRLQLLRSGGGGPASRLERAALAAAAGAAPQAEGRGPPAAEDSTAADPGEWPYSRVLKGVGVTEVFDGFEAFVRHSRGERAFAAWTDYLQGLTPPVPPRAHTLVMSVGLPGSGKSVLMSELSQQIAVGHDAVFIARDDVTVQERTRLRKSDVSRHVHAAIQKLTQAVLKQATAPTVVFVDGCHLTPGSRAAVAKHFERVLYLNARCPPAVAIARVKARHGHPTLAPDKAEAVVNLFSERLSFPRGRETLQHCTAKPPTTQRPKPPTTQRPTPSEAVDTSMDATVVNLSSERPSFPGGFEMERQPGVAKPPTTQRPTPGEAVDTPMDATVVNLSSERPSFPGGFEMERQPGAAKPPTTQRPTPGGAVDAPLDADADAAEAPADCRTSTTKVVDVDTTAPVDLRSLLEELVVFHAASGCGAARRPRLTPLADIPSRYLPATSVLLSELSLSPPTACLSSQLTTVAIKPAETADPPANPWTRALQDTLSYCTAWATGKRPLPADDVGGASAKRRKLAGAWAPAAGAALRAVAAFAMAGGAGGGPVGEGAVGLSPVHGGASVLWLRGALKKQLHHRPGLGGPDEALACLYNTAAAADALHCTVVHLAGRLPDDDGELTVALELLRKRDQYENRPCDLVCDRLVCDAKGICLAVEKLSLLAGVEGEERDPAMGGAAASLRLPAACGAHVTLGVAQGVPPKYCGELVRSVDQWHAHNEQLTAARSDRKRGGPAGEAPPPKAKFHNCASLALHPPIVLRGTVVFE
ncbi:RNA ligase/AAA domain containing protein [Diplonema papillatum]|nr:RNA ligase/AAA domain containing protein [Diplonema papillatum]